MMGPPRPGRSTWVDLPLALLPLAPFEVLPRMAHTDDAEYTLPVHLQSPPDPDFWRHKVGFTGYRWLAPRLGDTTWVGKEVLDLFKGSAARDLAGRWTSDPATAPFARQHLVLLGSLIEARIGTQAMVDVVEQLVGSEGLDRFRQGTANWSRAALVATAYENGLEALLAVVITDRWHALRRCVMTIPGHVPAGCDLTVPRVRDAIEAALEDDEGAPHLLHVFERQAGEVIVGLRRPFNPDAVWDADGHLVEGYSEEPVILRFKDNGHRVDLTAKRLDDAKNIADRVATRLLGTDVAYEKRRLPLTGTVLNKFLARCLDPVADDLQLVEVKAEMPGEVGRPVKTIRGVGRTRIESVVAREPPPFCEDWRSVHHVKVAFEKMRFTLHFPSELDENQRLPPDPDGDRAPPSFVEEDLSSGWILEAPEKRAFELTYSDLKRDTGVSEQFEQVIESLSDNFGAKLVIQPRSEEPEAKRKRRRSTPKAPSRITVEHWRELLSPVVMDPAPWQEARLKKLHKAGRLSFRTAWFFRCGDIRIRRGLRGGPREVDCGGVIEWESTDDTGDPYGGLDDLRVECDECQRSWRPAHQRGVLHKKLYIDINNPVVWGWVKETLGSRLEHLHEEAAGIASGITGNGRRLYLAYLPLVEADTARRHACGQDILWVSKVDDGALRQVDGARLDLAQLSTGRATWEAVLNQVASANSPSFRAPTTSRASPASPAASSRPVMGGPRLKEPPPYGRICKQGQKGRFYWYGSKAELDDNRPGGHVDFLAGNAKAVRVMLAALVAGHSKDSDKSWTPATLSGLHDELQHVLPNMMYRWIADLYHALDRVAPGVGGRVVLGFEPGRKDSRGQGYRMGSDYVIEDFDLAAEIRNWKSGSKSRGSR